MCIRDRNNRNHRMAAIEATKLTPQEHDELCCVYASLILNDAKMPVTEEKIAKLIKVSGNTVEPYYPMVFAKALEGQDITAILGSMGSAPAPVAAEAAPADNKKAEGTKKGGDKKEKKPVEEKKEEKKEEEVVGGIADIFGGDMQ
eukprot:TRINITY_DN4805_c0_g1_i4.p1 TRINITY_DN4805_c0_g1~~TRINITY_DN4805_c0_g1_i4.p1  ORF type:complete len:160 (-),score=73.29 TRINITY_DN4805_c0_g1_i4:126-560(-)